MALAEQSRSRAIWPWQDRNHAFSWLKASTFALMFGPAIWLVYQVDTGRFGRTALGGMTYWSGLWATAILLLALVVTPAATILRWRRFIVVRRMIGVTGLAYTIAHLIIYFALRYWNFSSIAYEMATRLSLIVATISTIGLVALGATSLDAAIDRIGVKNWQRLHNTVYALTALAVVHYLLSPSMYSDQYLTSGIFFWLIAWRALNRRKLGTDASALALLAVASCFFTAFLEAGWTWAYHGYEPVGTLGYNFTLDFGISPAWKVLALGLVLALAAASRRSSHSNADFDAREMESRPATARE